MKTGLKIKPTKFITRSIKRYNFVLFIIIVVGVLIASIVMLTSIVNIPYETTDLNSTTGGTSTVNDQTTIRLLSSLETSSTNSAYQTLPSGRINPFGE